MVPLHLKIQLHRQIDAPDSGQQFRSSIFYRWFSTGKISHVKLFPFKCGAVDMLTQVFPYEASRLQHQDILSY